MRLLVGWRTASALGDLNTVDPGQWMDAGDRILAGSWPFRDWAGIYGPLLYSWGTGWYAALGRDWLAASLMLEVVSPLACLALAGVTARCLLPGLSPAAGYLGAVAILGLDACYWSPGLRVWWPLAGLAVALAGLRARRSDLVGVGAVACGVSPFLSPEIGVAGMAACTAAIIVRRAPAPGNRGDSRPPTFTRQAALWAALVAPVCLAFAVSPRTTAAWARETVSLAACANWIWGVPFPGSAYPWRRLLFLAPFVLTSVVALLAAVRWARGRSEDAVEDLVIALFSAASLRVALGRTDTPHLLMVMPPVLLLAFRLAARRPGRAAAAILAGGLLPYVGLSMGEGQLGRALSAVRPRTGEWLVLPGERVRVPAPFFRRVARIRAAVRPLLPPGRAVLPLPGPIWAHLLRRADALPAAAAELLAAAPDGGRAAVAAARATMPAVVVVDGTELLAWDPQFVQPAPLGPVPARLAWSSAADEPATRFLRDWLATDWRIAAEVDGARILVPAPHRDLPEAREVAVVTPPADVSRTLEAGEVARLPVSGIACDEIRLRVRCRWLAGMAGLAKPYVRIGARDRAGRVWGGLMPVPPPSRDLDLRVPVPRVPLVSIDLEVGCPGSFNPPPRSVTVPEVRLIRYSGAR